MSQEHYNTTTFDPNDFYNFFILLKINFIDAIQNKEASATKCLQNIYQLFLFNAQPFQCCVCCIIMFSMTSPGLTSFSETKKTRVNTLNRPIAQSHDIFLPAYSFPTARVSFHKYFLWQFLSFLFHRFSCLIIKQYCVIFNFFTFRSSWLIFYFSNVNSV